MSTTKTIGEISVPKQWKNLSISNLSADGYPVYGANGIIGFYNEYNHEETTIAITCRGANCGNVHLTLPKAYITSNAMALDSLDKSVCDINYLADYLKFRGFRDVISGAAQPQITQSNLEKVRIPLPLLDDQIRISTLLNKVESLIAKRKKSMEDLDELLKSTFWEMFDLFEKDNKFLIKLGKISDVQGGLQVTPKRKTNPIEMPYLRVANVYRDSLLLNEIKTIRVTEAEIKRVLLRKGDILIVEGHGNPNEIGRSAVWDGSIERCLHQNHLIRVRVNEKEILPVFCSYYINSSAGRQQMLRSGKTTSGLNTISSKNVKDTLISVPPLNLQNKFAAIAEKVESIKKSYRKSLTDLENLYGVLSQKAFKGELDLTRIPLKKEAEAQLETMELQTQETVKVPQDEFTANPRARNQLLRQMFDAFLSDRKGNLLSMEDFWPTAEEKFMDIMDDESLPLGIKDYDKAKQWPGQTHLKCIDSKHFHEIHIVPTCLQAFCFNALSHTVFLLQEI